MNVEQVSGVYPEQIQGILLAGGRSARMGTDKAHLKIGGTTLAQRMLEVLKPLCSDILISTREGQCAPVNGYRTVEDLVSDKGPLMGIYSALTASRHAINIVVSCDIPQIHLSLLKIMLSFAGDYDIVVPSFFAGKVEPLLGIYRKECCVQIRTLLDHDILRVSELFKVCTTKIVDVADGSWYANLNTPEEFATYVKHLHEA